MCYGGLNAKYILRDIEARVKPVAFAADKSETPDKGLWERGLGGLIPWLWRWRRKEIVHG